MTIKGGCLCGQVRYSIDAEPLYAGFCHCRDCMKATGSGFGAFMGFRAADVAVSGETRRFTKTAAAATRPPATSAPTAARRSMAMAARPIPAAISPSMPARSTIPSSSSRKRRSLRAAARPGLASWPTCRNTRPWCRTSGRCRPLFADRHDHEAAARSLEIERIGRDDGDAVGEIAFLVRHDHRVEPVVGRASPPFRQCDVAVQFTLRDRSR